jgi:hypothetical protein
MSDQTAFEVIGPSIASIQPTLASLFIRVVPQAQLSPRTDIVFARQLNIARSQVSRLVATGVLKPTSGQRAFPKRASSEYSAVLNVQTFFAEHYDRERLRAASSANVDIPEEGETL